MRDGVKTQACTDDRMLLAASTEGYGRPCEDLQKHDLKITDRNNRTRFSIMDNFVHGTVAVHGDERSFVRSCKYAQHNIPRDFNGAKEIEVRLNGFYNSFK